MIRVDGRTIILTQANTAALRFRMYDKDRNAIGLADFTVTFMVKKSKKDEDVDALITKVVSGLQADEVTFTLLPDDTNIPVGTYWCGLQIKKDLYVHQCASGPFNVTDGVINDW